MEKLTQQSKEYCFAQFLSISNFKTRAASATLIYTLFKIDRAILNYKKQCTCEILQNSHNMEEFESTRKLPKSPATERSAASVSIDVEEVTPLGRAGARPQDTLLPGLKLTPAPGCFSFASQGGAAVEEEKRVEEEVELYLFQLRLEQDRELSEEEIKEHLDKILTIGKSFREKKSALALVSFMEGIKPFLGKLAKEEAKKIMRQLVDLHLDILISYTQDDR